MPVRDAGLTVACAIDSILAQTWRDFEFVIVDNGSTDGTQAIVQKAAVRDARIRLLAEPEPGIVPALNHGIAASTGSVIARMDADDVCALDRFERQLAYLEANPDIGVVGTGITVIDADGTEVVVELPTEPAEIAARLVMLDRFWVVAHPSVMMRRELVRELGQYRQGFAHAEDFDLWLRLAERSAIANLPDPLLRYSTAGMRSRPLHHRLRQIRSIASAHWAAASRRRGDEDPFARLPDLPSDDQLQDRLGALGDGFWLNLVYLLCAQTFTTDERSGALAPLLAKLTSPGGKAAYRWFSALPWDEFVLTNLEAAAGAQSAGGSWLVSAAEEVRQRLRAAPADD